MHILIHRVGGSLEPPLPSPHLSWHDSGEVVPAPEGSAELPCPLYVFVEGLALELDEHVDGENAAVNQVGQCEIDDPVLCREVYRPVWLCTE